LINENDQILEDFAKNLFRNLTLHLRKNKLLKATIEFVKALNSYPGIGIVLAEFC